MENVHKSGLRGIDKLTSKDCVRIYYSNSLENIPIILVKQMMNSNAKFEFKEVNLTIKNAADCMILFDLRDIATLNKKAEFIIISNDTDFDKPIEDFRNKGIIATKQSDLESGGNSKLPAQKSDQKTKKQSETPSGGSQQSSSEKTKKQSEKLSKKAAREQEVRSFINREFKSISIDSNRKEVIESTIQVILKGKSRSQINNELMKIYDHDSIKTIYNVIKPVIKDLPGK